MTLIDEIKGAMDINVRISDAKEYFEAVFETDDLDKLLALVENTLGKPLKPPEKNVKFPKHVQKLVDLIGGLRHGQWFYLKEEPNGDYTYVALWPWQSDLSKITLKIGRGSFSRLD